MKELVIRGVEMTVTEETYKKYLAAMLDSYYDIPEYLITDEDYAEYHRLENEWNAIAPNENWIDYHYLEGFGSSL